MAEMCGCKLEMHYRNQLAVGFPWGVYTVLPDALVGIDGEGGMGRGKREEER